MITGNTQIKTTDKCLYRFSFGKMARRNISRGTKDRQIKQEKHYL